MSKKHKPPVHTKPKSEAVKAREKKIESSQQSDRIYWILFGVALIIFSYLRLRLAPMPFERDEGEYAYMGKLLLDGMTPYKDAYNMKLPGTYFMYAIIEMIFGKSYTAIHTGVWLMNAVTSVFLFLSIRKLFNPMVALITASIYGFMSLSFNFLGFASHATHFVVLFVSLALYFFARYSSDRKWISAGLTGLMFGLSFIMKQQAVFFLVFGGIAILVYEFSERPLKIKNTIRNVLSYSLSACIPYLLVVLYMVGNGNFDKFWFWTFEYAAKYVGQVPMSQAMDYFKMTFNPMYDEYQFFWLFFFGGLIILWLSKFSIRQKIFAFTFALFAFLTTCPGFYFRQHYFIPVIPAAALIASISSDTIFSWMSTKTSVKGLRYMSIVVFAIIIIAALQGNAFYYFKNKPEALCRSIYNGNPFTESVKIAKYINEHSSKEDKIAVLGSEPQIMYYSDRMSATGYVYTYNMMEIHDYNKKMQHEMIDEIEKGKPLFIVYVNVAFSWLGRPESPKDIFEWSQKYVEENYEVVGLADLVSPALTNYYWDADAKRQPEAKEYVLVFKRKV